MAETCDAVAHRKRGEFRNFFNLFSRQPGVRNMRLNRPLKNRKGRPYGRRRRARSADETP